MNRDVSALASTDAAWLDGDGPDADVVVATRARLARNLAGLPFPHRAGAAELGTIAADLDRQVRRLPAFAAGWAVGIEACESRQRQLLREKMLAGPALLAVPEHRVLLASADLGTAALVNGEDHLHLCAWRAGLAPAAAVAAVMAVDDPLGAAYAPAFSEEHGYLTASPGNVGTGLRLTALLHLPGLVMADEIDKVINALRQLEFGVRGLVGEGRTVRGALFRVGNLTTLGRDETEIADDFASHVGKVIVYERAARELLLGRDRRGLEDIAWRGLSVLRSARLITAQEAWDCLSSARLGAGCGLFPSPGWGAFNRLLVRHQSAHLELAAGHPLDGRGRAAARADLLRELFAAS
ncbi:MAG: ATP--guanido phosphotransferase [bacterium]|nr:ATP--guanido phosphotransferase [bacterium]